MKIWEKGYSLDKAVEDFTVGDDYLIDKKLVKYDCIASIAHAKMLGKIGILKKDEVRKLAAELEKIIELDSKGKFEIKKEDEDCHTAIENHLTNALGDLGKKIHTARSRNDQVLTALRLYCKDEISNSKKLAVKLSASIKAFVVKYGGVKLPGYTHMRKAMPSSIGMWGGAFADALSDDVKLLDACLELVDQCPLGTGAGYGIPLEIDRAFTAKELGFSRVQENPIYAQESRGKFESTIIHALSQIMFDLNKIASDLALFSMLEFGYFELPKEFCTGSSIMPQKKNPDVIELLRAKYHEVISNEFRIKSMTAGLISGYNRDLQLTKAPLMESFETTKQCVEIALRIFGKLEVNKENCGRAMTNELYAAEKAYGLAKKGVPFRDAYRRVSKKF